MLQPLTTEESLLCCFPAAGKVKVFTTETPVTTPPNGTICGVNTKQIYGLATLIMITKRTMGGTRLTLTLTLLRQEILNNIWMCNLRVVSWTGAVGGGFKQ